MDAVEAIKNYILFLITECGLSVTLHPRESEELITFSELWQYNVHVNPYCTRIKTADGGQEACILQQKKVFRRCKAEGERFCGVCHAGVFEYVYPFSDGERVMGFISVGGYAAKNCEDRLKETAARFSLSEEQLRVAYRGLKTALPSQKRIDTLITPLCQMLELAYRKGAKEGVGEPSLIGEIIRYVRRHYDRSLTVESLCREFSCSLSYFSHAFKGATGQSFREYLTELRLRHAKHLLVFSRLSVTEIAFTVGFNDSNYFSSVFKRLAGVPPLEYRGRARKEG